MVTTKSGLSTISEKDTASNSKQTFKSALTLSTPTIKSKMKLDLALQHILDTVLTLRQEHCIRSCFDNDDICTLQEMLSPERDDIIELQYKDQSRSLLPIKKHRIGLIISTQRLLHL